MISELQGGQFAEYFELDPQLRRGEILWLQRSMLLAILLTDAFSH